jgi:hypothetical protein
MVAEPVLLERGGHSGGRGGILGMVGIDVLTA